MPVTTLSKNNSRWVNNMGHDELFLRYVEHKVMTRPDGYAEPYFSSTRFGNSNLANLFMRFNPFRPIKAEYTQEGHHYLTSIIHLYLDLKEELDKEAQND